MRSPARLILIGLALPLALLGQPGSVTPTNSALTVNTSTGAVVAPVNAATFRSANDLQSASGAASSYQPLDADLTSWAALTRASGFDTFTATPSSANLRGLLTDEVGTGAAYFVGGALGTPASATLTNATGLPVSTGLAGLGTNVATWLATPSSANLAAALTDETGTGATVFANTPTLVTPNIGAATGTSLNLSGGITLGGDIADTGPITISAVGNVTLSPSAGNIVTTARRFTVTDATASTSTTTGSATFGGGIGVAGSIWGGGQLNLTGGGAIYGQWNSTAGDARLEFLSSGVRAGLLGWNSTQFTVQADNGRVIGLQSSTSVQGNLYPNTDGTRDLGLSTTNRWRDFYLSGSINGGASGLTVNSGTRNISGADQVLVMNATALSSGGNTVPWGITLGQSSRNTTNVAGFIDFFVNNLTTGTPTSPVRAARLTPTGDLLIGHLGEVSTWPTTIDRQASVAVTNVNDFPGYALFVSDGTKNVRGTMFLDASTTQERWAWDTSFSSASNLAYEWRISGTNLMTLRSTRLEVLPTTASTSTTTGALTVGGGLGVAGAVNAGSVTASGPFFTVSNTTAAGIRGLRVQTSASDRWVFGGNGTAESGSNAGTDFQISAYADNGAFLSTPVSITRSTGAVNIATALTVGNGITATNSIVLSNRPSAANGAEVEGFRADIGADGTLGALAVSIGGLPSATGSSRYGFIGAGDSGAWRTFYVGGRPSGGGQVIVPGSLRVNATNGTATDLIASATATLDFGSIAAGASADLTITVTGASTGDSVSLGLPAAPAAGIIFQGFVSASNTVTVRATNITASPVDPASATYRATVLSF